MTRMKGCAARLRPIPLVALKWNDAQCTVGGFSPIEPLGHLVGKGYLAHNEPKTPQNAGHRYVHGVDIRTMASMRLRQKARRQTTGARKLVLWYERVCKPRRCTVGPASGMVTGLEICCCPLTGHQFSESALRRSRRDHQWAVCHAM